MANCVRGPRPGMAGPGDKALAGRSGFASLQRPDKIAQHLEAAGKVQIPEAVMAGSMIRR